MLSQLTTWFLLLWAQVCGSHEGLVASGHGLAGPVLGNILVASAAGVVTLVCFVAALRMIIRPGEHDPNHPKYRILSADR